MTGTGYFWLKSSTNAAVSGDATTARVESTREKVQYVDAGAGGGQVTEGYTIRIRAEVATEQTVATFKVIARADKTVAMPLSFYLDMTDPRKPVKSFETQELAIAEQAKPAYTNWAADGVVVLVCIEIGQS